MNRPLNIVSFNLARNVIANEIKGSEALQVAACQFYYDGGWSGNISSCTKNALQFLSQYDLFGLQEVDPEYQQSIKDTIPEFNFVPGSWLLIGYRTEVTGPAIPITPVEMTIPSRPAKDNRGIQAVWFPYIKLLFINLHAPHEIELKKELELSLREIDEMLEGVPERVILVGDFNDSPGHLLEGGIVGFGRHLWIPQEKSVLTCCTDVGHQFPGDYILVDRYNGEYYGLPPNYVRGYPMMSDHDPVVLLTRI